jgi:hypothetical protein
LAAGVTAQPTQAIQRFSSSESEKLNAGIGRETRPMPAFNFSAIFGNG